MDEVLGNYSEMKIIAIETSGRAIFHWYLARSTSTYIATLTSCLNDYALLVFTRCTRALPRMN